MLRLEKTLEDLNPKTTVTGTPTTSKKPVAKKLIKKEKKESKLKKNPVKKTVNKMIKVEPDSESDGGSFVSDKSRNDIFGIDGILEDKSDVEEEPSEIKPGAWVVVKYVKKVRQLHFVGQIICVNDAEKVCEVRFVRKITDTEQVFKWPDYVDEDHIPFEDNIE